MTNIVQSANGKIRLALLALGALSEEDIRSAGDRDLSALWSAAFKTQMTSDAEVMRRAMGSLGPSAPPPASQPRLKLVR